MCLSNEKTNHRIKSVINAAKDKLEYVLLKLSFYSSDRSLSYSLNGVRTVFSSKTNPSETAKDLYQKFEKFNNPSIINKSEIQEWQYLMQERTARLSQMVLLIRYYVKVTKSRTQIDNFIKQFNEFYSSVKRNVYAIDDYSLRTVKNFVYNSRLQHLCEDSKSSYKDVYEHLNEIESIQNDTFIYNYFPYLKAVEFLIENIQQDIDKNESKTALDEKVEFLNKCYKNLENNLRWSRNCQSYPFQLMHNECLVSDSNLPEQIFYPSSFIQPAQFRDISIRVNELRNEIRMIEYGVRSQNDRLDLLDAKNQIKQMSMNNIKLLGGFTSILTFLFGIVTFFSESNSPSTSLNSILLLGCLLVLLVSCCYIAVDDALKKVRPYIYIIFSVIAIVLCFLLI